MKASHAAIARILLLSSALLTAGCVPAPDSTPAPTSSPSPAPVQQAAAPTPARSSAPQPAPTPHYESWMDAPRTPGDWSLATSGSETVASFGAPNSEPRFAMSCDLRSRQITLTRPVGSAPAVEAAIRTETIDRAFTIAPSAGAKSVLRLVLPAGDSLFDAMALTKGRFAVETEGLPTLYLPAWAEVTRVIEDCR